MVGKKKPPKVKRHEEMADKIVRDIFSSGDGMFATRLELQERQAWLAGWDDEEYRLAMAKGI